MINHQKICLTFDIEEFDTPKVDYKVSLSLEGQLDISYEGTIRVLEMLESSNVKATFFVTGVFATAYPELIQRMSNEGHEVASHSYHHGSFVEEDYAKSKKTLESIIGRQVFGYRSPRMAGADVVGLQKAGYIYDSSTNPCYLPGKYNNFRAPRKIHQLGAITEIPASVATFLRIPLFWLAFHWLPINIYFWLCSRCYRETGFVNLYFHPWEFSEQIHNQKLRIPAYIRHNAGEKQITRLSKLIGKFAKKQAHFLTMNELLNNK